MKNEISQKFIQALGSGTGATRLRQLKDFSVVANLPLGEGPRGGKIVTQETVHAFLGLDDGTLYQHFRDYRHQASGSVRLSVSGLEEIRQVLLDQTPARVTK